MGSTVSLFLSSLMPAESSASQENEFARRHRVRTKPPGAGKIRTTTAGISSYGPPVAANVSYVYNKNKSEELEPIILGSADVEQMLHQAPQEIAFKFSMSAGEQPKLRINWSFWSRM